MTQADADLTHTPWLNPDEEPFIRLRGVTKKFGDFTAVDHVDLDIFKGELFCLLGGSGCGKSTLLRMLAGFETPTSGQILIDGVDMSTVPAYERPTNMMFQSYALFPHMTVEKNIAYGLKMAGVSKSETNDRVDEVLRLVELQDFKKRKPNQLSGGQRQRVALARALVKEPKVLLLDEPLGALDKRLREQTQFELMNIQDKVGITFIVVTHDQEEAMTLSTRIAVMDAGTFCQIGTPTDIYEYPETRFVADFIGSANMLEGRVVEASADHVDVETELGVIRTDQGATTQPGTKVWLAIRPEKIHMGPAADLGDGAMEVKGTVQDVGYLGDVSIYKVRVGDTVIDITEPNSVRRKDRNLAHTWDEEVTLSWAASSPVMLVK